jgi:hypothetical protein
VYCCVNIQLVLSEKTAVKECTAPSQGMPVRLYAKGLPNGGENVCDTAGTAVLSVIVSVPVGGGLLNSIFPEMEKVLVRSSQTEGFAVIAIIEQ